VLTSAIIS